MHNRLVAVGTPDGLRGRVSSSTGSAHATAIQLTVVTDAVVAAARQAGRADVKVSGNTVTVPVGKPERDNPGLVKAIVAAGGEIQFVSELVPTLEEAYLKLLGGEKDDTGDKAGQSNEKDAR
jgi:ABC-2 type transport system ATP-binding protein